MRLEWNNTMDQVYISDIGLAAFLKVVKSVDYAKLPTKSKGAGGKKFIFTFNISETQLKDFQSEYLNSKFRLFDQEVRSLKQLVHG